MAIAAATRGERAGRPDARIYLVSVCMMLLFSILGLRLWQLQIIKGEYYRSRADAQRLYPQRLKAPRGLILGGDGQVLADTRPAFDLMLVPNECPEEERDTVATLLQQLLGIDKTQLLKKIESSRNQPFGQVLVKQDVPKAILTLVEENSPRLPGVLTVVRPQRRYSGKAGGQLLGFLSEVTADQMKRDKEAQAAKDQAPRYSMGDLIGQAGVEKKYDDQLRGKDGRMVVSVYSSRQPQFRTDQFGMPQILFDSFGRKLEEEKDLRRDAEAGVPLKLTLDMGLQAMCEQLLEDTEMIGTTEGCRGAITVLNAETGAVLAMASTPGYDPGIFVTAGHNEDRKAVMEVGVPVKERLNPMRNRNYEMHYPPGSTFKVMMACAALEEHTIEPNTTYGCNGYFSRAGLGRTWRCWTYNRGGHGGVDIAEALGRSCDVFFYQVGLKLGEDKLKEWATRMGLGVRTGLDLPGELTGNVPDPVKYVESMKKKFPKDKNTWRWPAYMTINMSIGQALDVTPLQNAVMMACVVNGGRRVRPYINAGIGPDVTEPFLSADTLKWVQEGMRRCVEDNEFPRGTGLEARVPGIVVLGKTGTAQAVAVSNTDVYGKNEAAIPYAMRDHALFVCGVPDPEKPIAISIMIEHGLHGSSTAAPLAKKVIEYYYEVPPEPEKKTKVAQN
ncbi:MAG: penicillin-binding protein 2 [FCB group bacterium]|jgi:penicillin-binding protein 2|nr:penicillin-binding protein 2 [FCB group bacterium]